MAVANREPVSLETPGLVPMRQPRPEPPLDRYNRYVIPDPVTGNPRAWTRATTWAKTVSDTFALTRWELRMAAVGFARRPDLLTAAAAVIDPDSEKGKKKLNTLVEAAKEHAGATQRAHLGTALHEFAEAIDTGRPLADIPKPFDEDIRAYREAMRGVKVSSNYVEKICLLHDLGIAGTMDRLVAMHHWTGTDRLPMVADLKTGTDLKHSWTEIAIQLALYAHADTVYDVVEQKHRNMTKVDQKQAMVIHLPAREGRCVLYLIDIEAGWEMAQVCGTVRAYRQRKDLAAPLARFPGVDV
jgi:hypothetical protein